MKYLHNIGLYFLMLVQVFKKPQKRKIFRESLFKEIDELGLKSWYGSVDDLKLITHVVFHPIQKALNRQIQIDYTVRIQTLTNLSTT